LKVACPVRIRTAGIAAGYRELEPINPEEDRMVLDL
jgi:hypothetical protein